MKFTILTLLWILLVAPVSGQDTTANRRIVVRPAYLPGMINAKQKANVRNADSLALELAALKSKNDSLSALLQVSLEEQRNAADALQKAGDNISNLQAELKESKGDQLQTSHTSSILLIFNIIAGIILLVTLFWMYARKKTSSSEDEEPVMPRSMNGIGKDQLETRMERIEKLGKLRDKGLLTEEEFQLQKKQILGY
jgi:hypothetical protein